ncbi:hypothetical protein G9A89_003012 [Geosiphon pyriformis]|nr:hypothetical protein G9A89_003012 [Geosiphon pyriformis]
MDQLDHQVDCAASTKIIIANGAIKILIGEIDDLLIKINGIIVLIKVLVMEAIQYQALIGNNWLFKTNVILDWNIQKLQLSQNVMCGHFKPIITPSAPLIEFNNEEKKLTWEAYQISWADNDHNELPPETYLKRPTTNWKLVAREVHTPIPDQNHLIFLSNAKTTRRNCFQWKLGLHPTKITEYKSTITASHATKNSTAIQNDKASGTTNHVSLVENTITRLDGYPHNENKIWQIANAKFEGAMSSKILEIKNNSSEPVDIVLIPNSNAFLNIETGPEEFHEHYQNLAPTKEEQKQHLEKINT